MRLWRHRLADMDSLTIMESTEYLWASETMNWTSLVSCWNSRLGYQPPPCSHAAVSGDHRGPSEAVMTVMHLLQTA